MCKDLQKQKILKSDISLSNTIFNWRRSFCIKNAYVH